MAKCLPWKHNDWSLTHITHIDKCDGTHRRLVRLAGPHSFLYLTLKLAGYSKDASDLQTLLFSDKRGSTELTSRLL